MQDRKSHKFLTTKRLLWLSLVILSVGAAGAPAGEVRVGDTVDQVKSALGEPTGYIGARTYEMFIYERGKVELEDGRVVSVQLISEGEAQARRLEAERRAAEQARLQKEQAEARRVEGEQVKAQTLSDPNFLALPAGEQVAFWEAFRQQYPEVDVEGIYATAVARYRLVLQQAADQQRLAELQAQVDEAQARARAAEAAAASAQVAAQQAAQDTRVEYVYRSYYWPTYVSPYRCRVHYRSDCNCRNDRHDGHGRAWDRDGSWDRDHDSRSGDRKRTPIQNQSDGSGGGPRVVPIQSRPIQSQPVPGAPIVTPRADRPLPGDPVPIRRDRPLPGSPLRSSAEWQQMQMNGQFRR